jgi:hypothetical protein
MRVRKRKTIKKAEKLSQYFGPTSTYEKLPLRRGIIPNTNVMPKAKYAILKLNGIFKEYIIILL